MPAALPKKAGVAMKSFTIYKLPAALLCLGGVLVLAPSSRAQSEVAPDHFDGTDSWAAAATAKVPAKKAQPQPASAPTSARSNRPAAPSLQPVAAREAIAPRRSTTKKRKPTTQIASN